MGDEDYKNEELRDMFAAFALQALIERRTLQYETAAKEAFGYADAMMKERSIDE